MGWWTTEDGLLVGDGPLDAAEDFLDRVKTEYARDHKRRPSMEELLEVLAAALRPQVEDIVDGCDDLEIVTLHAKARKRPKKQAFKPGDVFAIPLTPTRWAFGRVSPQHLVFEFFDVTAEHPLRPADLSGRDIFRLPYMLDYEALERWRWKIMGALPYKSGEFQVQHFLMGPQISCDVKREKDGFLHVGTKHRMATDNELKTTPVNRLTNAEDIEDQLRKRFGL